MNDPSKNNDDDVLSTVAAAAAAADSSSEIWFRYDHNNNIRTKRRNNTTEKDVVEEYHLLTWPIWHRLPRNQRRTISLQYNYKSIGEFEEYISLQQAIGNSSSSNTAITPSEVAASNTVRNNNSSTAAIITATTTNSKPSSVKQQQDQSLQMPLNFIKEDEDEGNDNASSNCCIDELPMKPSSEQNQQQQQQQRNDDLFKDGGGTIFMLPVDIICNKIFSWLYIDTHSTATLVSPSWYQLLASESIYQTLCQRIYLQQSRRKQLYVQRFAGSYRTMLGARPRIRCHAGVYVLTCARIKKIERDMFTEIPVGAVLESVYYRYLYFLEDGTVLYALTSTPPNDMIPRLKRLYIQGYCHNDTTVVHGKSTRYTDRAAVWGRYHVQRDIVLVQAQQEWQHIQLQLRIDKTNMEHGRFGYLTFDSHVTSKSGNFGHDTPTNTDVSSAAAAAATTNYYSDLVYFDVPNEPFRFCKDNRL